MFEIPKFEFQALLLMTEKNFVFIQQVCVVRGIQKTLLFNDLYEIISVSMNLDLQVKYLNTELAEKRNNRIIFD